MSTIGSTLATVLLRVLLFSVTTLTWCTLHAQPISVLFIGNSYTSVNDLPNTFRQLALSLGDTVAVAMSAPGGYTFYDHFDDAATLNMIASQPWDFVVLQEQSQLGALPLWPWGAGLTAPWLVQLIETNYECTYPVFYMTWGRENGDALHCPDFPYMCTYEGMQQGLRANYLMLAFDNDACVAPVGVAWKRVRDDHPSIDLYQADGSHPTAEGTYLAACVFYCTLFEQSCVGASFLSTLPPATAAILQGIATATVLDSMDTWNLNVPNGTNASFLISTGWANEVTCHHPGQGMHGWSCSDGQTSVDPEPTFTLAPGTHSIIHSYTDPCGNSDTAIWYVDLGPVGIEEGAVPEPYALWASGPSQVEVVGGTANEELWIGDLQGRTVMTRRLDAGRMRIPCPAGLYLWRIRGPSGATRVGKLLVQ